MTATVAGIHLGLDTHANRPAGNAVPDGSIYSCSTHSLVYKSNFAGNSWATWATLGSGGALTAVPSARSKRTSGGITANSTTWADLDTGMDLTIAAATGDILEVAINGIWGAEAPLAVIDVATWVTGAGVNWLGSGEPTTTSGNGLMGWAKLNASTYTPFGGSVQYAVQAGDISGGNVVLRLRYRVTNATGVTVLADSTSPFQWCVKNLKV